MLTTVVAAAHTAACSERTFARSPPDGECPQIRSVSVVSRIGDSGGATPDRKFARAGEKVPLFAVVETAAGTYSAAEVKGRKMRSPGEWPAACPITLRWHKVEAGVESYNNSHSAPPSFIEYAETEWKEGWEVPADVHPTLMHDEFPDSPHGFGTMRFKVAATVSAGTTSSEGIECRESGAACRKIHTVAWRKDDTYLGYLHELLNTPYIYGSKGIKGGHQTDLLVGSDCADLVVYGKRRQRGPSRFPYTYTGGLYKLASKRWPVTLDGEGYYLDRKKKRLPFGPDREIRPGDVLNLPGGHVGVLIRDDGDGFLDTGDFLLHTLFREPEIVPIAKCRWFPVDGKEVLRLKE